MCFWRECFQQQDVQFLRAVAAARNYSHLSSQWLVCEDNPMVFSRDHEDTTTNPMATYRINHPTLLSCHVFGQCTESVSWTVVRAGFDAHEKVPKRALRCTSKRFKRISTIRTASTLCVHKVGRFVHRRIPWHRSPDSGLH